MDTDEILLMRSAPTVRLGQPADAAAVRRLACRGALFDMASPDTFVLREVEAVRAYLSCPTSRLWVAEAESLAGGASGGGEVVGMVAVERERERVAHLRHLRVAPVWQSSLAAQRLIETAASYCRRRGYLKLVLDAPLDPDHAIRLLDRCGLHYTRCRDGGRLPMLEFYVDLYHRAGYEPDPRTPLRIFPRALLRPGGHAKFNLRSNFSGRAPATA